MPQSTTSRKKRRRTTFLEDRKPRDPLQAKVQHSRDQLMQIVIEHTRACQSSGEHGMTGRTEIHPRLHL
jgi:hypothetical protein